ncbi:MAG: MFS transporter [Halieaceae bacterium]
MKSFVPLIKTEWRLLLFGFAMTFSSSLGQTYFIALFSGEIRGDLGLSHGEFGAVYSLATLASAVILLWSGSLVDRMDLRRFSYLVILGLGIGCGLLASSTNVLMLFLAILVLRHLGQGLMSMAGATAMVRYLDHHKGKANALSGIGYSASEAILPSIVVAMLLWFSWREAWWLWAAILVLGLPLLVRYLLGDQRQRHQDYLSMLAQQSADAGTGAQVQHQWTRGEVIRDPLFYLFMPALLAQPMLFTGFMFHQVHLVEAKGWSLVVWGSLYTLYAITSSLMKLVTGLLVDRFGAIRLVPLVGIPMGVGLLILASADSLLVAVSFMVLLGITVGSYATVSSPFFAEMYGTLHLGSIKSVTTAAMVFASAIAPVLMGWLIDDGVSMEAMALGSVVYLVIAAGLAGLAYGIKSRAGAPG